ncbi:MAG: thioredoxin-dependent thiol peroxidase [Halobacteriovoraceae bacterium]|nr:thioredoxin-dependent thiol peroxidase [Halobacteriovoraceae bacterium]
MILEIGKKAPVFSLPDQDGKMTDISDFNEKKNIVLYFYPKAMTPGCTVQARGVRDHKKEFEKLDTVVLGISPDECKRLVKFTKKEDLNFVLLSDDDNKVAKQYGVYGKKKFLGKEYMGIHRTTFIIGKDGYVKYVMEKVNTKTHHDDVIDFIKSKLSS